MQSSVDESVCVGGFLDLHSMVKMGTGRTIPRAPVPCGLHGQGVSDGPYLNPSLAKQYRDGFKR